MSAARFAFSPAGTGDAAELAALSVRTWDAAFGASMPAADRAAHIAQRLGIAAWRDMLAADVVLVHRRDGAIRAFAQFGAAAGITAAGAPPGTVEIRRLYVDVELIGQGIGSALLGAALRHPRVRAARAVRLEVWARNHAAIRLYQRFGFTMIAAFNVAKPDGGWWDTDWVMERPRRVDPTRPAMAITPG